MLRKFLSIGALLCAAHAVAATNVATVIDQLPPASIWLKHASDDLLPWWRQPAALGQPVGRFPTFRCADGAAYDAAKPCAELAQAPAWMKPELGRNYVRMQARQVFAYSVGFHLTGDPQLLAWARAGVDDIRSRALDAETGSPATYFENGKTFPAVGERTAQDIAYAGIALASVYYLTRDPALVDDLDRLHRHLMTYFDAEAGEMRWTLAGPDSHKHELVAQLDPLNAYMVLVTPLLQGERQQRWKADMRKLTTAIRTRYCPGEGSRCSGTLQQAGGNQPGARHNDFGHSGKAFWMLGLAAGMLQDADLKAWADTRAKGVLREAYVADTGSWASRWRAEGIEPSKSWWIYAELDQLASTLALQDASYAQYLSRTWAFWLQYLVDHQGHEVWGGVSATGAANPSDLKQHHWKNGYHSMEHALVEYLTSSALKGTPATLYFAKSAGASSLSPYVFDGKELSRKLAGDVLAVSFALSQPSLKGTTSFELPLPVAPAAPAVPASAPATALAIKGQSIAITPEMLPTLSGVWKGQWIAGKDEARGPFELDIKQVTPERMDGRTSAFDAPQGEKGVNQPFSSPARLVNGKLQLPESEESKTVEFQLSELDSQRWLQWTIKFQGVDVTLQVRQLAP